MSTKIHAATRRSILIGLVFAFLQTTGLAADPLENARLSLVRLEVRSATGEHESSQLGFVISSKAGLVLTARPDIKASAGASGSWLGSKEFVAVYPIEGGAEAAAPILDLNDALGLMLLKLPTRAEPYSQVDFHQDQAGSESDKLHAFAYTAGVIVPISGTSGKSYWNKGVFLGEAPARGSPILDSNGSLVGIAVGEPTRRFQDGKQWDYVRITYADLLLTPMHLGNTLERLQTLDSKFSSQLGDLATAVDTLRRRIDWDSVWDASNAQCQWRLTYKKLIPGPPYISRVRAILAAYYKDPAQKEPTILEMEREPREVPPHFDKGAGLVTDPDESSSGNFCLDSWYGYIHSQSNPPSPLAANIHHFVKIDATLLVDYGGPDPLPESAERILLGLDIPETLRGPIR